MKDWNWGLLLFVLLVIVLINPFKANLREYHGGVGRGYGYYGGGCRGGCARGGGVGGWGGGGPALNPLYYGYDEDYYYVLPKYFPFPLGYS